ncbi:PREDICTED: E3 ubiquitin-protein ligase RNF126-like, partial [Rhagoletis zephyria]|uniref:E3 ubiquitin-protein ligase RNF126-like n=1 Tax=Rhagoletis zephyria TaxID=28612 RepID=UPI0008118D4A
MPLRHSTENLSRPCVVCREYFSHGQDLLRTACNHSFHRSCLLSWLKQNKSCPQCKATCTSSQFSDKSSTGIKTRSQASTQSGVPQSASQLSVSQGAVARPQQLQTQTQPPQLRTPTDSSDIQPGAGSPPITSASGNTAENELNESRIRNIVTAVVSARQAVAFEELENR